MCGGCVLVVVCVKLCACGVFKCCACGVCVCVFGVCVCVVYVCVYVCVWCVYTELCQLYRFCLKYFSVSSCLKCGPCSSVDIATGYGLDGPGIESRWGRDFPHVSRPALGPTQPPVQ